MKTAIILLSGALLLIGCATGQSRRATAPVRPVAARTAPSAPTFNYVTSAASGSSYATAQPLPGGG